MSNDQDNTFNHLKYEKHNGTLSASGRRFIGDDYTVITIDPPYKTDGHNTIGTIWLDGKNVVRFEPKA